MIFISPVVARRQQTLRSLPAMSLARVPAQSAWAIVMRNLMHSLPSGLRFADIAVRAPFYHDAARILNTDLPYIPLFRTPLFYVINNRLQGIVPAASVDDLTWNLWDWDVVE